MVSRRDFGIGAALAAAGAAMGPAVRAAAYRAVPQRPSARVIVDNDFAGDPDGLVALAHQLLTPKTRTVLVTASALDRQLMGAVAPERSAAIGADIAAELIRRAGIAAPPPVVAGSEVLNAAAPEPSAAARAIVAEAMREDKLPLVFTCGGPLTNLAAALRLEPAIAGRMRVIWIGGGTYPAGGWEYNLSADIAAARAVIEQSAVPLWQIPQAAYRQMQFSVAELADRLRPVSPFGAWLYDRFTSPPAFIDVAGAWPLGDSPTVLLSAIATESSRYQD
ncbi:MAG TPA: nucleoside hydrolase, partial [Novosphingobium sp.]|nr:nucleoside hydrolase [Novosphingobium sp.]